MVVEKLSSLTGSKFDTLEILELKRKNLAHYTQERVCGSSHCTGDANPLKFGSQTLFINAAIEGTEDYPVQLPWLVDIELPMAGD